METKKQRQTQLTIKIMIGIGALILLYISGLLGYAEATIPTMQKKTFGLVFKAYESNSKSIIHSIVGLRYGMKYLGILLFAYIFTLIIIWGYQKSKSHDREGYEQGSAKFMNASQFTRFIKKYADPVGKRGSSGRHNIILAKDTYMSFEGHKTKRNCNTLITGGTGTGKTFYYVIPNMLQANCSYIVADISGELTENTSKTMEMMGIEVKSLNLVHLEQSYRYNPFDFIRTESKLQKENDIDKLVTLLLANTVDEDAPKGEKFWEDAITALYSACISYLLDFGKPEERNFAKVLDMVNSGREEETIEIRQKKAEVKESELIQIFKNAKEKELMEVKAGKKTRKQMSRAFKSFDIFMLAKPEVRKNILISASVRIAKFSMQSVATLTSTDYEHPEMNLNAWEIAEKQMCIYIYTPTVSDGLNFLASLFYSQLFDALYYRAENIYKKKFIIQDRDGFPIMTMFDKKKDASDMLLNMQQNAYIRKVGKVEREYTGTPLFYDTDELIAQSLENDEKEARDKSFAGKVTNKIKAKFKKKNNDIYEEDEEVEINDYGEELSVVQRRNEIQGYIEKEIVNGELIPAGRYMYQIYLPTKIKKEVFAEEATNIYNSKKDVFNESSLARQTELDKRRKKALETDEGIIIKQFASKKMAEEYLKSIKTAIVKKGSRTCPWHIRFMFDEFTQLTIPKFSERLSTVRKYSISIVTILQNLQQLDEKYEKSKETIKGNCDINIFLGSNSVATAKEISEQLGHTTNKTKGTTVSKNGTSTSYTQTQRALKDTTELITMANEECTISFRGELPMLKEKFDCTKHPRFQYTGLYDDLNKNDEEYTAILFGSKIGVSDLNHIDSTKSMLTQEFNDRNKAKEALEKKMLFFINDFIKKNPTEKNGIEIAMQEPEYIKMEQDLERINKYNLKETERTNLIPKILDVSCTPKDFGFLGVDGENINNLAISLQQNIVVENGQMDLNTYSEERDTLEKSAITVPNLTAEEIFMVEY